MCRACELPSVRRGVHAGTDLALFALQQAGLLAGDGPSVGSEEVGWSESGEELRVVRDGVHVYETTSYDLLSLVREQSRMATSDLPRAARLRLTGNGVVPAVASLAFRTLWRQLADAGHAEREGGQMRAEANGKHAMSLHHVVAGWTQ